MAFADDMMWADAPTQPDNSARMGVRPALFWTFAAGALLACAVVAPTVIRLPAWVLPGTPAIHTAPAIHARPKPAPAKDAAALAFLSHAETFLRDSLALENGCADSCACLASEIAEAAKLGHFGPNQGVAVPLPTGLPLQAAFALQSPAPAAPVAAPALPLAAPPVAKPAPIVVAPAVTVPLPPVLPAPRLDRAIVETVPLPVAAPETKQASIPPVALPPAVPGIARQDGVAVYDISAAMVYMPDGQKLEAHSGLGSMVDDPRYVDRRNVGPTPPNTYNLVMRKGRFHGVDAVRLLPVNGDNKYGRDGLLAHPYMLRGRPGESNGCVVFKDYRRFLDAFMHGKVTRMVVVPSLKASSVRVAALGQGGN